jgi:hypothetical protein
MAMGAKKGFSRSIERGRSGQHRIPSKVKNPKTKNHGRFLKKALFF